MELQFQKELEFRQLFLFISINKMTQTVKENENGHREKIYHPVHLRER